MGLEGLEQVMDRPEHVRGDLYLLTAAGHSGGSGVPKSSLPDPHHTLFFMLYLLKAGVGSCCLLGSAVISGVWLRDLLLQRWPWASSGIWALHWGHHYPSGSISWRQLTIFCLPPRGFFGENTEWPRPHNPHRQDFLPNIPSNTALCQCGAIPLCPVTLGPCHRSSPVFPGQTQSLCSLDLYHGMLCSTV